MTAPMAGGLAVCAGLAAAAFLVSGASGVPAMLLVLGLAMAVRQFAPRLVAPLMPGIGFAGRQVLRAGVALLGLKVVLADLMALGPVALGVVLAGVLVTVGGGYLLARAMGEARDLSAISATSVAICGASAALAASSVVPRREGLERDTVLVIVVVSLISTAAMLAYPALARALGFSGDMTAVLLGGAIHDVAQVAGAGFAVSPEVGVESVAMKMVRVACLLPVVVVFGLAFARQRAAAGEGTATGAASAGGLWTYFPPFLLVFAGLAMLASTGMLPAAVTVWGGQAANAALLVAVAGIGLKTALDELTRAPPRLIAVLVAQTLLQLAVVAGLVAWAMAGP